MFRVNWASPRAAAERSACARRHRNRVLGRNASTPGSGSWSSRGRRGLRLPERSLNLPSLVLGDAGEHFSTNCQPPGNLFLPSLPIPVPLFQFHPWHLSPLGNNELLGKVPSLPSSAPPRAGGGEVVSGTGSVPLLPYRYPSLGDINPLPIPKLGEPLFLLEWTCLVLKRSYDRISNGN